MRIPDVVVYAVVLMVVVGALFGGSERAPAPEAPPLADLPAPGPALGGPTPFDEIVVVDSAPPSDSVGTAFAIDDSGVWVTAKHVINGCDRVLLRTGWGANAEVTRITQARNADLAILETDRAPAPLPLGLDAPLRIGEPAYGIGYPQGRAGEVAATLMARSTLLTRGPHSAAIVEAFGSDFTANREAVIAWAEIGRTRGLSGSLGGLSGGPLMNGDGAVVGVVLAESPRRGRIYTSDPGVVARFIAGEPVSPEPIVAPRINPSNYGNVGDELRRDLAIVKVVCDVF